MMSHVMKVHVDAGGISSYSQEMKHPHLTAIWTPFLHNNKNILCENYYFKDTFQKVSLK